MSIAKSAACLLCLLLVTACQDRREFDLRRGPFLTLEEATPTSVRISWGDDYAMARELRVERKKLGKPFKVLARLVPSVREFTDDTVEESRDYKYRLRAIFPGGRTDRSVILQVTVPPAPVPLLVSPLPDGEVSPDGRLLARAEGGRVLVCDLRTGSCIPASSGELGPEGSFCWLPDSRHLVIAAGAPGEEALYLVALFRGESRRLTSGRGGASAPEVTPDGHWLLYRSREGARRVSLRDPSLREANR